MGLGLGMRAYWGPNAARYFSRVFKERIMEAVREGVSEDAARRIVNRLRTFAPEQGSLRF